MKKLKLVVLLILVFSFVGCSNNSELESLTNKVSALENQLQVVEEKNERLESEMKAMKLEYKEEMYDVVVNLEDSINNHKTALLSVSEIGYDTAATDIGNLLIYIENIKEVDNGCELELVIGNPNFITVHGARLHIEGSETMYGKVNKEVDLLIDDEIDSGAWNTVNVTIPYVKLADIEVLSIGLETDDIALRSN